MTSQAIPALASGSSKALKILATLKVTNPGTANRTIGGTIPIKWTTTTNCSANGGPQDDGFRIELIGKTINGEPVSKVLKDPGQEVFDNEGPTGILKWHWDWKMALGGNYQSGTYSIRVKNWNGKCQGDSDTFTIMYPKKWVDLPQKSVEGCNIQDDCLNPCITALSYKFTQLGLDNAGVQGPPAHALVGTLSSIGNCFKVRSWVRFSGDTHWHDKIKKYFKQARLVIKRKWKSSYPGNISGLSGLVFMNQISNDPSWCTVIIPQGASMVIPVNTSQGDTMEVDVTQKYADIIESGKPDFGLLFIPFVPNCYCSAKTNSASCSSTSPISMNAEVFDVTLRVEIESNEYGTFVW